MDESEGGSAARAASSWRFSSWRRHHHAIAAAAAASGILVMPHAQAEEIDVGNPDWSLRFDNTVKLSTIYRLQNADPVLVDTFRQVPTGAPAPAPATFPFAQAENFNAGDDNFRRRSFVSKRIDLLSEFDAVYRRTYGLRLSGAAWYDDAYRGKTDAMDRLNGQTPFDEFPSYTRTIAGRKAELLDAFVFGAVDLDGHKLTLRLGRHALQYGESLFFGDNAIAKAQGPVDVQKLQSSPNAQFKELIRPESQVSGNLQILPNLSLGGYYQFHWEADRLPPAGSYFATTNTPWGSSQPEFVSLPPTAGPLAGDYALRPDGDHRPRNTGQYGAQLKWRLDETDLGLFAANFHEKDGQLYSRLDVFNPSLSRWYFVFPADIKVYGASASQSLGDFNVSLEGSVRTNMPLRSQNMIYAGNFGPAPRYATGRTAHVNLSTLATFGPNLISRESSLVAEIAWNRVLHKDDPDHQLDADRTRDATAVQAVFTPGYRQALPGLDLFVPLGVRYSLQGRSSITSWDPKGSGNATFGLDGNYLNVWRIGFLYTKYIGKPTPFFDYSGLLPGGSGNAVYGHGNSLADRDYVSLSVRRTF